MRETPAVARIRRLYRAVAPELDERRRRQWAAAEARELGYGGVSVVARATGLARSTIHSGLRDLQASRRQRVNAAGRIRGVGAGRPRLTRSDPGVLAALFALIEPTTRGDPESPLRWTCKSTSQLASELTRQQHPVSPRTVATWLKDAGYSLQANQKTREGASHPDRDAQFRYLMDQITTCQQHGDPAISVDTNYDPSAIMDRLSPPSRPRETLRRWPVHSSSSSGKPPRAHNYSPWRKANRRSVGR